MVKGGSADAATGISWLANDVNVFVSVDVH